MIEHNPCSNEELKEVGFTKIEDCVEKNLHVNVRGIVFLNLGCDMI